MKARKEKLLLDYIQERIENVQSIVCDNLCKYRKTSDDDLVCDYMREHDNRCPLDELF